MANINKNELYNLICEYYEDNLESHFQHRNLTNGMSYGEWRHWLDVEFAPATLSSLVREGKIEVYERGWGSKATKLYYKPLTDDERERMELADAKYFLSRVETERIALENRRQSDIARIEREYKEKEEEMNIRYQECLAVLEKYVGRD